MSPNQKLDVAGNVVIRGAGTLYNNAGAAELHVGFSLASAGTAGEVSRLALQPYGHTGGPFKFVNRDDASNAYLDLRYGTSNLLTVIHNGNIGIGTTSPAEKLDVAGNIKASGYANIGSLQIGGVEVVSSGRVLENVTIPPDLIPANSVNVMVEALMYG